MVPQLAAEQVALDRLRTNIGLQSSKTSKRMNQIDRLRANGVDNIIALPQLVVSGDQSAGKSSVLEGITGIPFPRQDGLCTRFPTEIILRHDSTTFGLAITVSIIPHQSRNTEQKASLSNFHHRLLDFEELPNIIDQAAKLMGVRGAGMEAEGPAFAADVLRLELVGDTGLHLTIVDLPGLISVSENEEDVQLVENLVDSYLQNSRTIILAVVPASSDVDTQGIIQRARCFDKAGFRTVGIITKPDLINEGTESRVAQLANNCDRTRLNLGWFLLKNPSPVELKAGITPDGRRHAELRSFLEELLDSHIEREMPKVREDARRVLRGINEELGDLGSERKSPSQIRMFLTRISTSYYNLINAGVEGSYGGCDAGFFGTSDGQLFVRLRAAIHIENERFSDNMREHGEKRKVIPGNQERPEQDEGQLHVTAEEMLEWIQQVYIQTRGRELPGNYNHSFLAELFHVQSSRWALIAREHINSISKIVSQFANLALIHVIKDGKIRENVNCLIQAALEANVEASEHELAKLLEDETRQPITYNHYYTDNIQKARHDNSMQQIEKSVRDAIAPDWNGRHNLPNTENDIAGLLKSLKSRLVVDMKEQACLDAKTDLNAYYKVARKTFVDNVTRQVIERHILAKLSDAFNPTVVSCYSDEDLLSLAAESPRIGHRRSELRRLQKVLEQSLRDLAE
ncbi:Dynamin [Penicillium paradoxum]|uniref:Dynamin n=1 Tax=Penicillium paradoxum TaxID=176176 RepID=UPI00254723C9|nr:Dynamin [Penicillium paradoxum]KAJ5787101.1 Dynamin [Penicillium paradoxum]